MFSNIGPVQLLIVLLIVLAIFGTKRLRSLGSDLGSAVKLDGQSLHGKAPIGIARLARQAGKPCGAIVGTLGRDTEKAEAEGLSPILALTKPGESLDASIREAEVRIANTAETWAQEHAPS